MPEPQQQSRELEHLADRLLEEVTGFALQLANPRERTRRQLRNALRDRCRAAGLLVSTTELLPSRGTADGYRGRLALVVGVPTSRDGRGPLGPPLALCAVEIGRRSPSTRALHKLRHIPRHIPARSLVILTTGTSDQVPGIDRLVTIGA